MANFKSKKDLRPVPTNPAGLARAMFAVADKKIGARKKQGLMERHERIPQ